MKKVIIAAALLIFIFVLMDASVWAVTSVSAQGATIPTRTPTPAPSTPTIVPTMPPGPGDNPPPGDGSTQTPPTNTATATVEAVFYATAVPCSNQPTIFALNASFINVRTGPDTRYPVIESLAFREVRPIVGRDAVARWWLIQVNERQTGWVADDVVEVHGNTINVPVFPAPPLDGATVTPGAPWQPTAPPLCATPATATPTTAVTPTSAASDTLIVAPLETAADAAYPAATATAEPTGQTSVLGGAVTPTATATPITLPTSIAAVPQTIPPETGVAGTGADATSVDATGTDYSGLLLVGAALLLVAGTAVFLIKRR